MSTPKLTLSCPQVKDQIWTKEAERHFLPSREDLVEDKENDYLHPVEEEGVEIHEYVSIGKCQVKAA